MYGESGTGGRKPEAVLICATGRRNNRIPGVEMKKVQNNVMWKRNILFSVTKRV